MKAEAAPDLRLKGFRLWVHGREFPEAQDYLTADWLIISAELHTGHGWARVQRSACVMASDFANFLSWANQADSGAQVSCWELTLENLVERKLHWTFSRTAGGLKAIFTLTANPAREWHRVCLDVQETEWQEFKAQLRRLVEHYVMSFTPEEREGEA